MAARPRQSTQLSAELAAGAAVRARIAEVEQREEEAKKWVAALEEER
ncbi:hypothetical protein O1M54_50990 [Streptomyces diastatochromogenes]|nr:hypothetical protein [Streptomyces diastatochromogenes]